MILTKIKLNEFTKIIEDRYERYDLSWIKNNILKAMSDPFFNSIQTLKRKDAERFGVLCFKPEMLTLNKIDAMLFNREEIVYWEIVKTAYSLNIAILFAEIDGENMHSIALARSGTNLFFIRTSESYLDISKYTNKEGTE